MQAPWLGYGPIIPREVEPSLLHAGPSLRRELAALARRLDGRRALVLTLAPDQDPASRQTAACVRVMRRLGVDVQWFFVASEQDRDALTGVEDLAAWTAVSERIAARIPGRWDAGVVVGRPLTGVAALAAGRARAWALACPQQSQDAEAGWGPELERTLVFAPAVDPAANPPVRRGEAKRRARELGVDLARDLLCQVTGYGSWEPVEGVLAAYWQIKHARPAIQLVLACPLPPRTDAERALWRSIQAEASEDPDIHLVSSGRLEHANFIRTRAAVALSGVTRPAFGVEAAEAAFKGTPVVARRGGSADALAGCLTDGIDDTAERVLRLLAEPRRAAALGREGRVRVSLLPRLVRDWLRLLDALVTAPAPARPRKIACPSGSPRKSGGRS